MAETILQLFVLSPSESWYQMSKEEQDSLLAKQAESLEKVGGKNIVIADSAWSNEEWIYFGVNEFPDIKALQKHAKDLNDMHWFRHGRSKVILGTEWEQS